MNPTLTIHSDANGVTRTITLTKAGPDHGLFAMSSTGAPGADQSYGLRTVQADPAALKLTCQVDAWLSADIDLSIQKGTAAKAPIATIVVSHALFGDGTYTYTLRAGEDQLMQSF
jgi:hypothetical protein